VHTTLAPEHLAAIAALAEHRVIVHRFVGLAAGATKAAAGTVVVAVVLGTVVMSATAKAITKTRALIGEFLSLAGTMASVLLTIVIVIVGAGFLLIHHH